MARTDVISSHERIMGFRIWKVHHEDKCSVRELDRATVSGPRADLVL